MPVSNSQFLAIKDVPPLDGQGWEVRVVSYKDYKTVVFILNHYTKLMVGPMINDVGAGSISLSMEDSFWNNKLWNGTSAKDILDKEYLFECWEDGVRRFEFLGQRVKENVVNDDEEHTVTISGPGSAAALEWGQVFPPNFPKYKKSVHWWNQNPAMKMFFMLVVACQRRGTMKFIRMNFTHTKDSSGKTWADVDNPREYKLDYGENMLDMLNMMTGQDDSEPWTIRADWYMRPGFKLDVRQDFGAHLESKIIFFEGDIEDKTRERNRENIRNYVAVRDDANNYSLSYDNPSRAAWGQREHLDKRDGLTNSKVRKAVSAVLLNMMRKEDSEWTIRIPYDRETRRPFRDFDIGDYIGIIARFNGSKPSTVDTYRVLGITVDVDGDETTCELTLESWSTRRQKLLQRRLTRLLHPDPLKSIKVPNGYDVPEDVPMPVVWTPNDGFSADASQSPNRVFIQSTDPALDASNNVKTGDFWIVDP